MIDALKALSEKAGEKILAIYRAGNWTTDEKSDSSPVTSADLAANEIIVAGLRALSSLPIVSEESAPDEIRGEKSFWLVDPLDGTRDFVAQLDTFVVSIGLITDHYPVLGVIHAPVTGETWWAAKGRGAFSPKGEKIQNQSCRKSLIAAGSRSMPSERMQMFYDRFDIAEVRRFGSALKFCKLAEGEVDLYPRFGPTCEWDTAAGQIIAEEAGCKVLDIATGERLRYGKPGYLNQGGFMASREDLDLIPVMKAAGWLKRPR